MPILIYAHLFKIPKRISIPRVFNDDITAAVKASYSDINTLISVVEMAVVPVILYEYCLQLPFVLKSLQVSIIKRNLLWRIAMIPATFSNRPALQWDLLIGGSC
jgi:hypothetical protein